MQLKPNAFREFHPHDRGGTPIGCRHFSIPTGLCNPAQGCEARATLGQRFAASSTPTGLRRVAPGGPQPRWGWADSGRLTQGSSGLATLGFGPESRWDSAKKFRSNIGLRACLKTPERGCVVLDQPQQLSDLRRAGTFVPCCGWSATQPRSFFRQGLKPAFQKYIFRRC